MSGTVETILRIVIGVAGVAGVVAGVISRQTAESAKERAGQLAAAWEEARTRLADSERRCADDIERLTRQTAQLTAELALLRDGMLDDIAHDIGDRVIAAVAPEMRSLIDGRQPGGRRHTDPPQGE